MLSRTVRRALSDRIHLPPTFLLPWTAGLATVAQNESLSNTPLPIARERSSQATANNAAARTIPSSSSRNFQSVRGRAPSRSPTTKGASPLALSDSVRELLPLLHSQSQHYITVHIHGRPFLVTQGDTVRLPFLLNKVEPGDILRLNRALNLGSRDFTLKAPAPTPKFPNPTRTTPDVRDPVTGRLSKLSGQSATSGSPTTASPNPLAPHYIPNIAQGKYSYLDDRLFVCRAVVMSVDSEPMRLKEKTKRRQRHVQTIKSKLRFTVIKISELRVKSLDELEREGTAAT